MWVDRAIFTSLTRRGRSGYHLVARSAGVSEPEANALATWSPSHGALITDIANRTSLNFYPLPGGRFALSRTCEGPAEYSGRGGRQLYTAALIFDEETLQRSAYQPVALYRDALALGHLRFLVEPSAGCEPAKLSLVHSRSESRAWAAHALDQGFPPLDPLKDQLASGQAIRYTYPGDRIALVECLVGLLPPESVPTLSFTTSLQPSAVRPCRLVLIGAQG